MKHNFTGLLLFITALLLTGCSTVKTSTFSKQPQEEEVHVPAQASAPAQGQEQKHEIQCYQEFSALRRLDPVSYETYRQQFENINRNYKIYDANKTLVDSDASEVMLTEINRKLSLVCVRIKNAVYSSMMNRANEMNKL